MEINIYTRISKLSWTHYFISRLTSMIESGLIQKWLEKYLPTETKCDKKMTSLGHPRANLRDMSGICVVLMTGLTTSSVIVIMEICYARINKKSRTCDTSELSDV